MPERIIRSLCYFSDAPDTAVAERLHDLGGRLEEAGFTVQTRRLCGGAGNITALGELCDDHLPGCLGTLDRDAASSVLDGFLGSEHLFMNLDPGGGVVEDDVDFLFRLIRTRPAKAFQFAFTFNNAPSSPYFPSAQRGRDGFSLGLQPVNLAAGCTSLEPWLGRMRDVWEDLCSLLDTENDFLGIDSSVAPLDGGDGSLVRFIKQLHGSFNASATTDTWLRLSSFIKEHNPRPVGLCGVMLPCLEDNDLAEEYEKGEFPVERNIYLSLHSGLGVDTYPVGMDESQERILEILRTLHGLSNKYNKPLSARLVSDGRAKIGERTNFNNPVLKDVVVRPL